MSLTRTGANHHQQSPLEPDSGAGSRAPSPSAPGPDCPPDGQFSSIPQRRPRSASTSSNDSGLSSQRPRLASLPLEVHRGILHHLSSDDPHAMVRDLNALSRTSRSLRPVVQDDELLRPKYQLLSRLTQAADQCLSGGRLSSSSFVETCGRLLGFLGPQHRDNLVSAAIGFGNDVDKARAIAGLGAGASATV